MENLSLPDMLRLLEEEADLLNKMHCKIANEIHQLQVEEEMFMHNLEKLEKDQLPSGKVEEGSPALIEYKELVDANINPITENYTADINEELDQPNPCFDVPALQDGEPQNKSTTAGAVAKESTF